MYSYFNFNSEVVFFSNHWTHMYSVYITCKDSSDSLFNPHLHSLGWFKSFCCANKCGHVYIRCLHCDGVIKYLVGILFFRASQITFFLLKEHLDLYIQHSCFMNQKLYI